jgi:hypothetical protein
VVQLGRDGREAFGRQPAADVADVSVDAERLPRHDGHQPFVGIETVSSSIVPRSWSAIGVE